MKVKMSSRIPSEAELWRAIASAAGLMKELMGVANNAAWLVCLDAYDKLKAIPQWNRPVKGGHKVNYYFKLVFKAFKDYERRLIYDEQYRFFDLKDMPERTRKVYGDISNSEYYEFWASIGGSTYVRTKPLVTSLCNKYRLALIHAGIKDEDALTVAWGLTAMMCLNSAVTIYEQSLDMVSENFHLPRKSLAINFRYFSLKEIARLWSSAMEVAFPLAYHMPVSDTDGRNLEMGIRQLMEAWTDGNGIYDDMEKTLRDCGEDVMKSKGYIKKSIDEVEQLRKWHNED